MLKIQIILNIICKIISIVNYCSFKTLSYYLLFYLNMSSLVNDQQVWDVHDLACIAHLQWSAETYRGTMMVK